MVKSDLVCFHSQLCPAWLVACKIDAKSHISCIIVLIRDLNMAGLCVVFLYHCHTVNNDSFNQ